MTMQPQQQPPPGWYPHGPGMQRYWNGQQWTADVAPLQQQTVHAQPAVMYAAPAPRPKAVSGMTTGENIVHLILTICTLGLWAPFWWLRSRMSRRKILY